MLLDRVSHLLRHSCRIIAAQYMTKTDDEILQATLLELERLFPEEIKADQSLAKVEKFTCVRTPTSVYETLPGCEIHRPTQASPISNFFVAGGTYTFFILVTSLFLFSQIIKFLFFYHADFSKQKYLASMEGAILSGQLAAKAVAESFLRSSQGESGSPRQLKIRPKDPNAEDANTVTPDRTLYQVRVGNVPKEVQEELDQLQPQV